MGLHKLGSTQQKIILALLGGVALECSGSPGQYFKTFGKIKFEWGKINRGNFKRSFERLAKEKLIQEKRMPDGSLKLMLTENGKREAMKLNILGSSINFKKPKKWDKKWRIVIFDIPEKDRDFRGILRRHLFSLEFYKIQQSVFVSPYPFENQIIDLINLYSAEAHVRVITAVKIDNQDKLKKHFFGKK